MIVDAHAHISGPTRLWEHFRDIAGMAPGLPFPEISLSDDEILDSVSVQISKIQSMGTDIQFVVGRPWAIPTAYRRESVVMHITQQVNDFFARCVQLCPDRFVAMATLPQVVGVRPRNCIEELERCVNELGFIGCKINCDPGEGTGDTPHLGDPWWYPLYEKMSELDAPALLHGGHYNYGRELELGYYPAEVTIGALGLLRTPEVFREYPQLKIVVGHGGGYLPYQIGRARYFWLQEQERDPHLENFETILSHLYFDTVLYNSESIELLIGLIGVDNVIFGTDMPANGDTIDPATGHPFNDIKWYIDEIPWLSDMDRKKLFEENARKVYTRFRG